MGVKCCCACVGVCVYVCVADEGETLVDVAVVLAEEAVGFGPTKLVFGLFRNGRPSSPLSRGEELRL